MARGLGTRMRRPADGVVLTAEQAAVADTGVKAMIAAGGRPFLDHVLSGLADAGCREVCLVIGPEHQAVRERYTREVQPRRLRIGFAIQPEARGTADAVLAAEDWTAGEPFLVINSDNLYPAPVLAALRREDGPALPGFNRATLVREGNVPAERIASYALLEIEHGFLRRIVEKPDPATLRAFGDAAPVSMNCWRFGPDIFAACRAVEPSERGELELPHAVQHAVEHLDMRFRVIPVRAPVLDLSSRGDIPRVAARLAGVQVRL